MCINKPNKRPMGSPETQPKLLLTSDVQSYQYDYTLILTVRKNDDLLFENYCYMVLANKT